MAGEIRVRAGTGTDRTEFAIDPDALDGVLTATRIDLLCAVADGEPESVRATARLVDRDVKNVHGDLRALGDLGLVEFDWGAKRKRPVVPYDELAIVVTMRDGE